MSDCPVVKYTITVANKPENHWFRTGSKMGYQVNGKWVPIFHLAPGYCYRLTINAPTHPFYLTTDPDGGGENFPGSIMDYFGVKPTEKGIINLTVPADAVTGNIYYAQCGKHPRMGFFVYIYPYA